MFSIANQLSALFSFKWIRKHLRAGDTSNSYTQGSLQSSLGQSYRPKAIKPVGSNRYLPENPDNWVESKTSYMEGFQYHGASNMVCEILKPGFERAKENTKHHTQKMRFTTSPCPVHLQLLELPPSPPPPPPNTPLPEIPIHDRLRAAPDQVSQKVQDRQVSTETSPRTKRNGQIKGSLIPKHVVVPPRTTSTAFSSSSYEKSHKPQRLICPNTTATKQLHRHVAELYDDPWKGNEKVLKLRRRPVQEPLSQVTGSQPGQKPYIRPCDREFIHPFDKVIIGGSEFARSSPRSHPSPAVCSPQLEYNCDTTKPIISQPCLPNTVRPITSPGNSTKVISPLYPNARPAQRARFRAEHGYQNRPHMRVQETRSNHVARGQRQTGKSPKPDTKVRLIESRRGETLGLWPKTTPYERPIPIVLGTSKSATYLPMREAEPRPVFTKKSAPNLRRSEMHDPLRLHTLPQPPKSLVATQPPWLNASMTSAFDSDDEDKYSCLNFLHSYRRKSSEERQFSKGNSSGFKRGRSTNASESHSVWI
ncbi:hypothetical protein BGZ63DRAFT_405446 [Mariannaea sp. PMI_226]|nr:hypothetical protein BGZ63DRAFT_405446 [Mariannaea sp. PMI_226]